MKLSQQQVKIIQESTGLTPIPSQAAADSGLAEHFGDHTFYVDTEGVYVFDAPGKAAGDGADEPHSVTAVAIATVEPSGEGNEMVVRGIDPRATTLTVELV